MLLPIPAVLADEETASLSSEIQVKPICDIIPPIVSSMSVPIPLCQVLAAELQTFRAKSAAEEEACKLLEKHIRQNELRLAQTQAEVRTE